MDLPEGTKLINIGNWDEIVKINKSGKVTLNTVFQFGNQVKTFDFIWVIDANDKQDLEAYIPLSQQNSISVTDYRPFYQAFNSPTYNGVLSATNSASIINLINSYFGEL
jgi:hypothetical protein